MRDFELAALAVLLNIRDNTHARRRVAPDMAGYLIEAAELLADARFCLENNAAPRRPEDDAPEALAE